MSGTSRLSDAIVAIGDYAVGSGAASKNRLRLALTARFAEAVQRVRMTGTAALDLAWLAEGKIDAALTLSNHPWDMAAGVAIAREAGAVVIDRDGTSHCPRSSVTLAVDSRPGSSRCWRWSAQSRRTIDGRRHRISKTKGCPVGGRCMQVQLGDEPPRSRGSRHFRSHWGSSHWACG